MKIRISRLVGPALGLVLLGAAVWVLHLTLREYHYRDVMAALRAIPRPYLLKALGLTLLNYAVLTGYDFLALRYIQRPIPYHRIAFTSFISYAFSQNLGFGILTGGSLRYRLYSAWGLSAAEVTNVVAFCALTFWLGIFGVGGLVFCFEPLSIPATLHLPFQSVWPVGVAFLMLTAGYMVWCSLGKRGIRVRSWEFAVPGPQLSIAQLVIAGLDWAAAGAVLYVILPEQMSLSFPGVLGIFILAQVVGLISHVPGGLGVFEAMILYSLSPELPASLVLGSLLAFRVIYYFVPLGTAIAALGTYEFISTKWGAKVSRTAGQWVTGSMPTVLALVAFVGGVILLFSGATPAVGSRLQFLDDFLPLSVIEVSHFVGSLVGAALLFLALGVQRRVDVAYHLAVGLLVAGIAASLLKGFDYEEALILTVMLVAFLPSRNLFYRKSSLIRERFTIGWIAAISVAILSSVWIGFFSYKHVEYSNDLWWHFSMLGDAPRFLRATVGVVGLGLIVAIARLLRPAQPEPGAPTADEIAVVEKIVSVSSSTTASLALLGDKTFLFNDTRTAFIMYGIEGRSWVAMGDPVGPSQEWRELAWRFRDLSVRHGGWTVFYQVRPQSLPLYLDLGLTLQKLGEEARVDLTSFSLDGQKKTTRHSYRKVVQEGTSFEIAPVADVPALLPELKQISDTWLLEKNTREKRFSLGSFNEEYLSRFPMALARQNGRIVAFANVLHGGDKEELSVDLMRFVPDAPSGTMDYLFLSLMIWGKEQSYRWFNLGMAPLSGLESRHSAPLWIKVGSLVFRHGEQFYNFQGLRAYKEKFQPVWEPRYLASPGGMSLPRVLTNVSSLISGGLKGVVVR